MKESLLTNRLLMAQGAIALFEKNIKDALIIAREHDKVRSTTDDQEQELQSDLEDYGLLVGESSQKELFF